MSDATLQSGLSSEAEAADLTAAVVGLSPQCPKDPGLVTVRRLFARAEKIGGAIIKTIGHDAAVIAVQLPGVRGTEPTREGWMSAARGGQLSIDRGTTPDWLRDRLGVLPARRAAEVEGIIGPRTLAVGSLS